jgi:hypothetical protein
MEDSRRNATMLPMSTPTVIESPLRLEPVTADPFIDDLAPSTEARSVSPAAARQVARPAVA